MSLSSRTDVYETSAEHLEPKSHGYSFILALVCFTLTLLVLSAVFSPVSIGRGISNESIVVGL
jgi:hypothetical protein